MSIVLAVFQLAVMAIAPIFVIGVINRVKSIWAGRRGPRLDQSWYDLVRLLRKTPVYSQSTSWLFPIAPLVVLAATMTAGLLAPAVPGFAILSFPGDWILFSYLFALGRIPLMLGALDTASAFEGMGASREATYSALLEPVLLLALGTLGILNNAMSFQDLVSTGSGTDIDWAVRAAIVFALFVVLLIESSRIPADDPNTHLELTMVHEVMVLDHSGPELAVVQYSAALKMTIFAAIIASVLNPFPATDTGWLALVSMATSLILIGAQAALVGWIESLTARLRFRALPMFILAAFAAIVVALVAVIAHHGGLR